MKSNAFPFASRLGRAVVAAGFLCGPAAWLPTPAHGAVDPNLTLTIACTNQNTVLRWFGSNAVAYQVESSATLAAWSNCTPVLTGSSAFLFVTNPMTAPSGGFFRVKRIIPDTTSAAFDPGTGILTIIGDELNNIIVVSRDGAGAIRVNNGAVPVTGGVPTVANTTLIQIFGRGGHDQLSLDEANGPLPRANMFGEAGDDTLTGGSGADILNGSSGSDTLLGKGGADSLLGGDDNDTITGGDGDDIVQMGVGNDRFIWNPGDDTDIVDGNDGADTVEVNGGNGAEDFTITANGARVRFDRVNPAPFFLDLGTCEFLVLNANGGNDTLNCTGDLASLIQITADGGAGDDTLRGSNGADLLRGGDDNDFIDGNQGIDVALLGAGNDVFQWDPGDGSDTVEGQSDTDRLLFNGSAAAESIEISPNGARLRFFRNIANVTLDLAGVETVDFNALGGADIITVNDLSATEVTGVNLLLAGTIGGSTGDLQGDSVIVNGSTNAEIITATQAGADLSIAGLEALVTVRTGETNDLIAINAQGGNDTIDASGISSLFALTIDGGAGDDTITGSARADVLIGGADQDTISGRQGNDFAYGGSGGDTFVWNPGDGNDVVEGQADSDTLLFLGANINENLDLSANGARLRFFRDVANVTLDCDDVERVEIHSFGGADNINFNELTATDVTNLVVDLGASGGGGDGLADSVTLNGTQTNDAVVIVSPAGAVLASGLSATLTITNAESANDTLVLNALGAADTVDASGLAAGRIKFTLNGGLGADVLIGSQGGDLFTGGDGDDVIFGSGGDDTLVWNPGDDNDTFEGQAGSDTLQFNGANIAENIDMSANGTRFRFFRNIANVVMDCNDVEIVRWEALGGADIVNINDLSATDVTAVNINLASTVGGSTGDAQADTILVSGTATNDAITVTGSAGLVTVAGLAATISLASAEGANDSLTIGLLAGDDFMDATGLVAGVINLTADGGVDDDVLSGSGGADVLYGGDGDDVLIGGPGLDALDGGTGNNIVIQD